MRNLETKPKLDFFAGKPEIRNRRNETATRVGRKSRDTKQRSDTKPVLVFQLKPVCPQPLPLLLPSFEKKSVILNFGSFFSQIVFFQNWLFFPPRGEKKLKNRKNGLKTLKNFSSQSRFLTAQMAPYDHLIHL